MSTVRCQASQQYLRLLIAVADRSVDRAFDYHTRSIMFLGGELVYMPSERWKPTRRTFLGTTMSGTAIALAGCTGDADGGNDTNEDTVNEPEDSDLDDSEPEDEDQQVEQLDSPAEFPDGEECAVCNMVTPDYPEWNAQLVGTDGTRVYFCSSGCMSTYIADPEHFGGDDEEIENVWVTDYETGELIDATESYYVRVKESSHVDDVMMKNPTPFTDRDGAETFIDELNDGFDADYDRDADVITFDDFDMDNAMFYREQFFEDGDDHDHDHDHDDHSDH